MDDYIEREKAIHAARYTTPMMPSQSLAIVNAIESILAADVRPVTRGEWEAVMLDHERMGCRPTAHYCSECHQITWFRTFFCPNCGAMMEVQDADS